MLDMSCLALGFSSMLLDTSSCDFSSNPSLCSFESLGLDKLSVADLFILFLLGLDDSEFVLF